MIIFMIIKHKYIKYYDNLKVNNYVLFRISDNYKQLNSDNEYIFNRLPIKWKTLLQKNIFVSIFVHLF